MIEMSRPFASRHLKHFLFEIIHFDANFNFSFGLHFTSFPKFYSYFRCCLECKEIIIVKFVHLGISNSLKDDFNWALCCCLKM